MFGDFPPSSSRTFFRPWAACPMICLPTAFDPVKLTMSTPGWVVRCSLAATSPVTTLSTPGGSPTASAMSPSTRASSGVSGDGLSTTVQPTASAGITFTRFEVEREVERRDGGDHSAGSFRIAPWPSPRGLTCGRSASTYGKVPARSANHSAYRRGVSNWSACAIGRAEPASRDDQVDELVAPVRHRGDEPHQEVRPLARRHPRPRSRVERPPRGAHRAVDVGDRALGHLGDDLLGRRVEHGDRALALGLDPPAVHVELRT